MTKPKKAGKRKAQDKRLAIFAHEYAIDFNGTRAYKAAGYSPNGADAGASRLLRNVRVKQIVAEIVEQRCSELSITKGRILRELALMGFANMRDYMTIGIDGQADVDLSDLSRDQAAAIQEITVDTTGGTGDGERRQVLRTKFKLAPKRDALELLGNHLKLFSEKHEITGADGQPLEVTVRLVRPTLKDMK